MLFITTGMSSIIPYANTAAKRFLTNPTITKNLFPQCISIPLPIIIQRGERLGSRILLKLTFHLIMSANQNDMLNFTRSYSAPHKRRRHLKLHRKLCIPGWTQWLETRMPWRRNLKYNPYHSTRTSVLA